MKKWYNKYSPVFYKWVEQHKVMLLLLCALAILRGKVVDWMVEYICSITECAKGWWTLPIMLIAISIIYIIHNKRIRAEQKEWVSRYWTLILLLGGYLLFRFDGHFDFYGYGACPISYTDYAWVYVLALEILLWCARHKRIKERVGKETNVTPFITDAPAKEDEMGRGKYAEQLVEKIYATHQRADEASSAFAILLNEHYGAGKTTFMMQLQGLAELKKMDVCWFKPWLYDDSKMLVVNFIRVIQEKIGDGDKPLQKMLSRYAQALSSIEKFEWLSAIVPEATSIETQFEEIKTKLQELKQPIIVLIDDVDRLQNDELLRMLQMVRNIGDFPSLYYIVAADKEALQNRLHEAGVTEPDEYLKKFFNIEITFPADDMNLMQIVQKGVTELSRQYTPFRVNEVWDFIREFRYRREVFGTIRDVKRYLNVLDYTLGNLQANDMVTDVSLRDLAGICMIECVDSEFYRILRDHREYVLVADTMTYKVRSDLQNLFMDRRTKHAVAEAIMMGRDIEPKVEYDIDAEIKEKVQGLTDLERWTKPTKMEIIGKVLEELFPQNHIPSDRKAVCYKTEFFKYFATVYRGTEMSNGDMMDMMGQEVASFKSEVLKAVDEGKADSMRLKMVWYLEVFHHNRIDALQKVMAAYEMECLRLKDKSEESRDMFFLQSYVGPALAVFKRRVLEGDLTARVEWEKLKGWLMLIPNHEMRLRVFAALKTNVTEHGMYIFQGKEEVKQMMQEYEKSFIQNVWGKNRYDEKVYRWIKPYRDLENNISRDIIDEVCGRGRKEVFLYHLVRYEGEELKWNTDFIDCVFGINTVFGYQSSLWRLMLPDEWKEDFINITMAGAITKADVKRWPYFQKALRYWKSKKRKK